MTPGHWPCCMRLRGGAKPIYWESFRENALLQLGYVVVCGALAYGRFTTRDVLA